MSQSPSFNRCNCSGVIDARPHPGPTAVELRTNEAPLLPMPNAQCPMPNAQRMTKPQCPKVDQNIRRGRREHCLVIGHWAFFGHRSLVIKASERTPGLIQRHCTPPLCPGAHLYPYLFRWTPWVSKPPCCGPTVHQNQAEG